MKEKMKWKELLKISIIFYAAGVLMAAGSQTIFELWPKKKLITVEHIIKSVDGKVLNRTSTTTEEVLK